MFETVSEYKAAIGNTSISSMVIWLCFKIKNQGGLIVDLKKDKVDKELYASEHATLKEDITEIKGDVKELLKR